MNNTPFLRRNSPIVAVKCRQSSIGLVLQRTAGGAFSDDLLVPPSFIGYCVLVDTANLEHVPASVTVRGAGLHVIGFDQSSERLFPENKISSIIAVYDAPMDITLTVSNHGNTGELCVHPDLNSDLWILYGM
jgi:hypothetical protein